MGKRLQKLGEWLQRAPEFLVKAYIVVFALAIVAVEALAPVAFVVWALFQLCRGEP